MDISLFDDVLEQQSCLKNHRVFSAIHTPEDLRLFMSWHVFAVWDFMSLVKMLQRELTNMETVWLPPQNPRTARLINEIVLTEETDELPVEGHLSHYEMYLEAMREVDCDSSQVRSFIDLLRGGQTVEAALEQVDAPAAVKAFVKQTIGLVQQGDVVEVLGSFYFGREDVIPHMFSSLLEHWGLDEQDAPMFVYYLKRHIELDSESHGPAALAMIEQLTQFEDDKIERLKQSAKKAIESRRRLWDALADELESRR